MPETPTPQPITIHWQPDSPTHSGDREEWTVGIGRNPDGTLRVIEDGKELDTLEAIERFGHFGSVIGWDLMDTAETTQTHA